MNEQVLVWLFGAALLLVVVAGPIRKFMSVRRGLRGARDQREKNEALFGSMFPELQPHFHPERLVEFVGARLARGPTPAAVSLGSSAGIRRRFARRELPGRERTRAHPPDRSVRRHAERVPLREDCRGGSPSRRQGQAHRGSSQAERSARSLLASGAGVQVVARGLDLHDAGGRGAHRVAKRLGLFVDRLVLGIRALRGGGRRSRGNLRRRRRFGWVGSRAGRFRH